MVLESLFDMVDVYLQTCKYYIVSVLSLKKINVLYSLKNVFSKME